MRDDCGREKDITAAPNYQARRLEYGWMSAIIGERYFSVKDNNVVTKNIFHQPKKAGEADENRRKPTRNGKII